jgi:hypothetical protein
VAFSPDGHCIATASWDGTAKVWDALTGRQALTLAGHPGGVTLLAWSPDGKRVLTGSNDQTAKLWDAATGLEVFTLKETPVAFSPDGGRILTNARQWGQVRLWEAASAQEVADWLAEERAAEAAVAAAEQARAAQARAEGFLQDWLVLAPIPLPAGQTGADGLDEEQLPHEPRLRPRAGDEVRVGGNSCAWRKHQAQDYFLDFNGLLAQRTEYSVAYAVCYILSEEEKTGLQLLVGSDDQAKVYLNGRDVYEYRKVRHILRDEDTVGDVTLNKGMNVLVFKVVNEGVDWKGCIRFVGKDGRPVKGLRTTLTPEP